MTQVLAFHGTLEPRYLSCAETARLVRAALKRAWPATTFTVRSRTYSGGAAIDVGWTDGPPEGAVAAVVGQYQGGGFDGSIDLRYSHTSWLLASGSAIVARSPGTVGSGGTVAAIDNPRPAPDAELVRFGSHFVFTTRRYSPASWEAAAAQVAKRWGLEAVPTREQAPYTQVGGEYFSRLVSQELREARL